jgi:hypothetical protein
MFFEGVGMPQRARFRGTVAIALVGAAAAASAAVVTATPPQALLDTARRAAAQGDAAGVLRATLDHLRSLQSLSTDGESVAAAGGTTHFSLRLGRPNLYRVTWTGTATGGQVDRAVWNSGEGPHVYSAARNAYVREKVDSSVFAVQAGVSNGLTRGLPPLFFGLESSFELANATLKGSESVDGDTCWVISGSDQIARRTLWISQRDLVVRRHRWSYAPTPEAAAQLKAGARFALDSIKERAKTPQQRAEIDFMKDMNRIGLEYHDVVPTERTETYRDIRTNHPLDHSAFVFDVPGDATLEASMEEFVRPSAPTARVDAAAAKPARTRPGDAGSILRAMLDRYRELQTLAVKGQIETETTMFGMQHTEATSFSALAGRPDRYRVTWSVNRSIPSRAPTPSAQSMHGAVWNAGNGPFIYLGSPPGYSGARSDEMALAMATGVSGGAAQIPNVLLRDVLATITDPTYEGEEDVGGESCHVISGRSPTSQRHTLWISQRRMVLRKHRRSLAMPPGAAASIEQVDDKVIAESLAQMGMEDTPEVRRRMAMLMEMAKAFAKHQPVQGTVTETYHKVRLNPRLSSAFAFVPPAGTPLKRSLLEGAPPGFAPGRAPGPSATH